MSYFTFDTRYLAKPAAHRLAIRHTFWVHLTILMVCASPAIVMLITSPMLSPRYAIGLGIIGCLAAGVWLFALGSWVFDLQKNVLIFETQFLPFAYYRISLENVLGVVRMDDKPFLDSRTVNEPGALLPKSKLVFVAWRKGAARARGEEISLTEVMCPVLAGGIGGIDSFQALEMAEKVTQYLRSHRPNQQFLDPTRAYDLLSLRRVLEHLTPPTARGGNSD